MSLAEGRLPSVKDKYEAACEADAKAKVEAAGTKVEEKPKRKKKNA